MSNGSTLGDILSEALAESQNYAPKMEYQHCIRVIYTGNSKIAAVKALRSVTGLTLKSAKDAIEWAGGIEMPRSVFMAIRREHAQMTDIETYQAWEEIVERPEPIKL